LDLTQLAASLSEIEKKTLKALDSSNEKSAKDVSTQSGLPIDSVRRALQWLKEKELIELKENKEECIKLSPAGKSSLRKGLPEKMFVQALKELSGKETLDAVKKKSQLNTPELHASMGLAKKNAWISIQKGEKGVELELTGLEKDLLEGNYALEKALEAVEAGQEIDGTERAKLLKRGLAEESIKVNRKAALNLRGEKTLQNLGNVTKRAYNVQGAVPKIFIGKRQPYVQFLNQLRKKLVNLGFKEMKERLIVQEFYNFDVLFQPQNHPARTWTDTYQLKQPQYGKLPKASVVAKIKAAHENGGNTGSRGWRYNWSEKIASKLMPTAHGTTADARQLVEGAEIPGKYFVINRCYRPDVVDASHLVEFNQFDGFMVGKGINFRHLLNILETIAVEVAGAEEVKFFPDYYPFTEPSVQLSAKHPKLGWIELAGGGVLRPEIVKPLGIDVGAIAWGMGIDRLAMFKLGVKDIRYLFAKDLKWMRESRMVKP
jgi:phenylalanyl-tRNA synthetase alpha chain